MLSFLYKVYLNLLLVLTARGDFDPLDPSWMDPEKYYLTKED